MTEAIKQTTSASEFQRDVVDASKQKPVLAEMGSEEWCPDCTKVRESGVLERIAQAGKVNVVQHETPQATVTEAWAHDNPDLAKQHGINPPANLSDEARLLSQSGYKVTNYPSVLLFDGGKPQKYYHEGKEPRRDRAIDSDLVERDEANKRRPREAGIKALEHSIETYRPKRRRS